VVEFLKIIGLLTDPVAYGGKAEDAFHVVALHLNIVLASSLTDSDDPTGGATPEELQRLQTRRAMLADAFADSQIQGTRPQSIGYGLDDLPAGLAGWIAENFQSWCDCNGDPESVFTKDELLTNIML
jgi:hypothetical protein